MDRRNFFKILSTASTGVMTGACGKKVERYIPLLVSDREIVPGEEVWHPGVCTECEAGCGIIARVMQGERIVERKGEPFRETIAVVKKMKATRSTRLAAAGCARAGRRLCRRSIILTGFADPSGARDRVRKPSSPPRRGSRR